MKLSVFSFIISGENMQVHAFTTLAVRKRIYFDFFFFFSNWNRGLGRGPWSTCYCPLRLFYFPSKTAKSEKMEERSPESRREKRQESWNFRRREGRKGPLFFLLVSALARYSGLSPIKSNDPEIASRAIINSNSRKVHKVVATSGTDNISRRNKRMH